MSEAAAADVGTGAAVEDYVGTVLRNRTDEHSVLRGLDGTATPDTGAGTLGPADG